MGLGVGEARCKYIVTVYLRVIGERQCGAVGPASWTLNLHQHFLALGNLINFSVPLFFSCQMKTHKPYVRHTNPQ